MYKFLMIGLCLWYNLSAACDFCGCSPSIMNSDFMSLQPQSSIGINTNYKGFKYYNNENGLLKTHMVSTTIIGSYSPKKWVELRATLPIAWMGNMYPTVKDKTAGLSDISILSNFKVVNKSPIGTNKKVGHVLVLGFGIELPSGKNKLSVDNQLQNFTLGSRSTDFLFSGVYSMNYRKWNVIIATMTKVNTQNSEKVRYGHLYTIQLGTAYTHTFKKSQLLPSIGLRAEMQQKNLHKRIIQKYTGSNALFLQYGADWMIQNWNIGFQILHPIAQNTAMRSIKQQSNFLLKCTYLIKKKKAASDNIENQIK